MGTAAAVLGLTPRPTQTIQYFGDYQLIQEIARGGMGVVFAARQVSLNRVVAVKRMLETALATPEQVRRFRAEAEAAASLRHPHIVGIFEIGEHEGQHYFSMEYIEGRNLAELVRDGPLAPRRAAELLRTIAAAVDYAHGHGILHRDLKPSNVIVDEHDQPHLTDFGLAKLLTGDKDLTLSGQALGTPSYMSPEQGAGQRATIGPGSDVYSLGAVLYHLLTGRPPFVAESPMETLRQAKEVEPVAPCALNASVPPDLETICLKCLAKQSARRYATAKELADDLERFLRGEPIHARPVTHLERAWRWCHREPALAGAIGAVALALVVVPVVTSIAARRIQSARGHELQERQRAERLAQAERARQQRAEQHAALVAAREQQRAAAARPTLGMERAEAAFARGTNADGLATLAALLRASPTNRVLTERLLSALSLHPWPLLERRGFSAPGRVTEAVFSPDGNLLATGTDSGAVRVWNVASGEPVTPLLSLCGNVKRIRFGAQGRYFAATTETTLRAWNTTSGAPVTPVLPSPTGKDGFSVSSRDRYFTTCASNVVSVFDLMTGVELHRLPHNGNVQLVMFDPSGRLATFQQNLVRLWRMDSGQLAVEPLRLPGAIRAAMFSGDGSRLLLAHGSKLEIISTTNGASLVQMSTPPDETITYVNFSPDSSRVLSVGYGGAARAWNAMDGQPIGLPMDHDDQIWVARFSGNGQRIITWAKDRAVRIWTAAATTRLAEPIRSPSKIVNAEISPDGLRVVVVPIEEEAFHLWRLPPRAPLSALGTNSLPVALVDLAGTNGWPARRTHDGRRVLAPLGQNSAQIADADTGQNPTALMVHQGPIRHTAFSANEEFVVTASADHTAHLWDATTGLPVGHPFRHAGPVNSAVLSEDGLRLVTASEDGTARVWDVLTGWPVSEPLHHPSGIRSATFGPDLRQVVLAGRDGSTRVVAVPVALTPVPDWLPDLAEAVAQKKADGPEIFQRVPPEKIIEVQQRITQLGGDDYYARWAKWFFAQPGASHAFPVTP